MSKILVSQEELCENVLEDWHVEDEEVFPAKHDLTMYSVIFMKDDKYYRLHYTVSYNNGLEDYSPYEAHEVEQKEIVKKVWRHV